MSRHRISEISIIAVTIAAFTVASFLTLQEARRAEPLLFLGLVLLPLLAVSRRARRYDWSTGQKRLVTISVLLLAGAKHLLWPCKAAGLFLLQFFTAISFGPGQRGIGGVGTLPA